MMAACTSDDALQTVPAQQERVPVMLSYTTQPQVETRAAAALELNKDYIESGKEVTVQISNHNANQYAKHTYTTGASGALTLPAEAPYYPLDGTHIDILAYFPASAGTVFTIESDQTTDDNYVASDLMWADALSDVAKTTSAQTLQFTHKMAKIVVNASAGTQISQINSVTLKQVKPQVNFNQSTGALSLNDAADAIDVLLVKENTTAEVSGCAVIPAQTIVGNLLEIGVTKTDGTTGTATFAVDSKAFAANGVYTLNIAVAWPEVNATTAITNWSENGSVTVNAQGSPFMTFTVSDVTFRMVYVEGTDNDITLTVGNQTTPGSGVARTDVTQIVHGISDFYIGQTEATNALWVAVMGGTAPSEKSKAANFPVTNVTYTQIMGSGSGTDADCFIKKLNDLAADQLPSGWKFILPSQVQWQFAAQGGNYSNGYTYAGSSTWGESAWNGDNSSSTTHQVATKPANELGLYDMSGNVWEWCGDWYYVATNNAELAKDYWCSTSGSYRVLRGGCWVVTSAYAAYLYPTFRRAWAPSNQNYGVGFRLALQFIP